MNPTLPENVSWPAFQSNLASARLQFSSGKMKEALEKFQNLLSDAETIGSADDTNILSEVHLLIAKCHKGMDDLKQAIQATNSAIEQTRKSIQPWKEPFLYRSACYQALHQKFAESDGDLRENIDLDREEADIIVDSTLSHEEEVIGDKGRLVVSGIDEALSKAKSGDKIFVEKGIYQVMSQSKASSPYFLFGKTVSIIGASTKDCILEYRNDRPSNSANPSARLDTFLICSADVDTYTLLKRFTFRSVNNESRQASAAGRPTTTRFLGIAAGSVHIEDCVFDGVTSGNSDVDAIYASAKICGSFASQFPHPPRISVRFCVFDHCQSFAAFTALTAHGFINSSLFIGSRISGMEGSKIHVENCEFSQTGGELNHGQTVSATKSDLLVRGSYIHGSHLPEVGLLGRNAQAISLSVKSTGELTRNYIYRSGNGIHCVDSELVCFDNIILNCSKKHSSLLNFSEMNLSQRDDTMLGLYTGISVKMNAKKLQISNNFIQKCDVGIYVGKECVPTIKTNALSCCFFTGVYVECKSRPNIINNHFEGRVPDNKFTNSMNANAESGLGVLLILESGGLIGKNLFVNFELSPIMSFASCRVVCKGNTFEDNILNREKQVAMETKMRDLFRADLFKNDTFFYIVDSEKTEKELCEIVALKN